MGDLLKTEQEGPDTDPGTPTKDQHGFFHSNRELSTQDAFLDFRWIGEDPSFICQRIKVGLLVLGREVGKDQKDEVEDLEVRSLE